MCEATDTGSRKDRSPRGPRRAEQAIEQASKIVVVSYGEQDVEERESASIEDCAALKGARPVTWIKVTGVRDPAALQKLGECFGLHPLVLEDIADTGQRPKLEDYDDHLFIVIKVLCSDGGDPQIRDEQVSLILGRDFVLSLEERESPVLDSVRARIRNARGHIRKAGADYLAYAIVDTVVDTYFGVLEALGEKIERLEEELIANATRGTLHLIHRLKSELILLRKLLWPMREVITTLGRGESDLIQATTAVYLRDVHDHTIEVIDTMETYRDMVSGMLDIYLSSISNRMNEIMKVLTIIATIFIPLTFITGIFGMNFRYMPGLAWAWAYPAILLTMAAIGGFMLLYFRKRKWL